MCAHLKEQVCKYKNICERKWYTHWGEWIGVICNSLSLASNAYLRISFLVKNVQSCNINRTEQLWWHSTVKSRFPLEDVLDERYWMRGTGWEVLDERYWKRYWMRGTGWEVLDERYWMRGTGWEVLDERSLGRSHLLMLDKIKNLSSFRKVSVYIYISKKVGKFT